jgi:hypothetical protein
MARKKQPQLGPSEADIISALDSAHAALGSWNKVANVLGENERQVLRWKTGVTTPTRSKRSAAYEKLLDIVRGARTMDMNTDM